KMSKQLIVLAALSLCCCFSILHASSRSGCRCLRTISQPVRHNAVAKIEVTPPSGRCRWTERIIYRKRGPKVCIKLPLDSSSFFYNKSLINIEKTTCSNSCFRNITNKSA
uniref:Chemokine interleukin-8-like domain-containing protein n=1 Tax=Nothobranchius furzeri TaxID=105023 RepID=A0A8C6KXQ6_NOTFU